MSALHVRLSALCICLICPSYVSNYQEVHQEAVELELEACRIHGVLDPLTQARMCSLTLECVLLEACRIHGVLDPLTQARMCSLTLECVLLEARRDLD